MKDKYSKLKYPKEFTTKVALKLGIERETIRVYLETDNVPVKHTEFINKCLDLQLSLDDKINKLQVEAFDKM